MLESFFILGSPAYAETGEYSIPLVLLSYLVASFAAYTALSLAQQLVNAAGRLEKRLLHWGGAFAMGAGIWSMHFIGMLSYKMDMKIMYDPGITLLSMLIAIAFSYGVLAIVSRSTLNRFQILVGGTLLGIGICSMHYTGMAAMEMDGDLRYRPGFFFVSVAIAIAASAAALWVAFTLARSNSPHRYLFHLGAAMIMGGAICGMHYTGMVASVFIPWADCRYDPYQNFDLLAISIAIVTAIILFIALSVGAHRKTRIEFKLQYSEQRVRSMIDHALDAIIAIDQQGKITEWNKQAEKIFGWSYGEVAGQNIADIIIPPEYRERHYDGIRKFLADGSSNILNKRIEIEALHKNGTRFPVELSVTDHRLHNEYHFTAYIRDITERKEAEEKLKHYTREIEDSNRSLDSFVYIVSHDLKEPVRGIRSFTSFLLDDYGDQLDEEGKTQLQLLNKMSERMKELIEDLLLYSRIRRKELTFVETDTKKLVSKTLELMELEFQEKNVRVKVDENLPTLPCDKVFIGEVFRNLIMNAIKYNDKEEKVIEIGCTTAHEKHPGENVFFVKDNGIGIPGKFRETVFDMFKRLHGRDEFGGGTGSGLAIVKEIIDRHNGDIWIESKEGEGSIFYFMLAAGQENSLN